jgi:hypothetical protein
MATLKMPFTVPNLFGWLSRDNATTDSRRAREFANRAYKRAGGATPELKRVYGSYLDNERRREAERRAQQ